jgi:gluconolactonase
MTVLESTSAFVAHRPAFTDVVGQSAQLIKLADVDAHEGPVYVEREDALYFTTTPQTRAGRTLVAIKRLALDGIEVVETTVVRPDANGANGMTLAPDGRLLVCEQGSLEAPARISAVDRRTGEAETVVSGHAGLPLNSPNDVVVKRDGTIWFTDPSYGHLQGFRPAPSQGDFVYRYDPTTGLTEVVASGFDKPNGLAFSPDERTLYIGDSGANHEPGSFDPRRPHELHAFDVSGNRLANERLFAVTEPGFPDGIKVDEAGRVYASAFSGVQVFDPSGELLDEIALPGAVNFCFGGAGRNVLFITTDTAVWAAVLDTKGA